MRGLLMAGVLALLLAGCSLPTHPIACARGEYLDMPGIVPSDCLPGTLGYDLYKKGKPSWPVANTNAPTILWNAPIGQQPINFAKDKYACMQEARSNVSGGSVTGDFRMSTGLVLPGSGSAFSREVVNQPLYAACMEAKGYHQQSQ